MDHRDTTRRSFAAQAGDFERPGYLFTARDVLDWIAAATPVAPTDRVLDVAGGTGVVGRHLSRAATLGVVLDLVPEMLAAGAAAAAQEGRRDVVFVAGDATAAPFPAGHFDVVACRFALHHVPDPEAALAEMVRVARPGGRVTLVDLVAAPGPEGEEHNRLERLRDPSHARALGVEELAALAATAGVAVDARETRERTVPAAPWLEQSRPAADAAAAVEGALRAEAGGGAPTGLRAAWRGAELTVTQTWALVAGAARPG